MSTNSTTRAIFFSSPHFELLYFAFKYNDGINVNNGTTVTSLTRATRIKILSDTLLKDANNQWSIDLVDNTVNSGFIIGRGVGFALSNEMSLKFKELCQEMIEPFSSAEVMHGPKSLIQDTFKLFTLSMNDKSGLTVQNDSNEITKYTKLVYNISSAKDQSKNFYFPPDQITEFDSIVIMSKFYPWIVRYTQNKGLDPDKPRYLTKVTQTF